MEVVLVLIELKFRETAGVEVTAHLFVTETEVMLAHGSVKSDMKCMIIGQIHVYLLHLTTYHTQTVELGHCQ